MGSPHGPGSGGPPDSGSPSTAWCLKAPFTMNPSQTFSETGSGACDLRQEPSQKRWQTLNANWARARPCSAARPYSSLRRLGLVHLHALATRVADSEIALRPGMALLGCPPAELRRLDHVRPPSRPRHTVRVAAAELVLRQSKALLGLVM
jgi:hypothetical protein